MSKLNTKKVGSTPLDAGRIDYYQITNEHIPYFTEGFAQMDLEKQGVQNIAHINLERVTFQVLVTEESK